MAAAKSCVVCTTSSARLPFTLHVPVTLAFKISAQWVFLPQSPCTCFPPRCLYDFLSSSLPKANSGSSLRIYCSDYLSLWGDFPNSHALKTKYLLCEHIFDVCLPSHTTSFVRAGTQLLHPFEPGTVLKSMCWLDYDIYLGTVRLVKKLSPTTLWERTIMHS